VAIHRVGVVEYWSAEVMGFLNLITPLLHRHGLLLQHFGYFFFELKTAVFALQIKRYRVFGRLQR
jgi:hypothetical protein